jgi:hypothetical protein
MRCYAFLHDGSRSPVSGLVWPLPPGTAAGAWVTAGPDLPRDAVRGIRAEHLARWFDDELWHVELGGRLVDRGSYTSAERGRLLERVTAWTAETAQSLAAEFAFHLRDHAVATFRDWGHSGDAAKLDACTELGALGHAATEISELTSDRDTARLAGYVADAVSYASSAASGAQAAGVASFIAAYAIAGADRGLPDSSARYEAERRWQADRVRELLHL